MTLKASAHSGNAESIEDLLAAQFLQQDSYIAEELLDDAYLTVACPDMWSQTSGDPLFSTCNVNTSSCGSSTC